MRKWKNAAGILLMITMVFSLAACGNRKPEMPSSPANAETERNESKAGGTAEGQSAVPEEEIAAGGSGKALVAYFAYSENMGDTSGMTVDAISSASLNRSTTNTEGNLQVMAKVIEEGTGADVFHIRMTEPYVPDYSTMQPVAIEQLENEDWPALQEQVGNLSDYDVIYLGTPVWDGSLPPAMHTFFAENDLNGKTIVPFGINLGSGFGRIPDEIEELAPGATVMEGFTVNATTTNDEVETEFRAWLDKQNFIN
ncbi:MAG: flavodoxin [Eubacteriales bacterium]|nr:flavodoxin [Eubacteriales bacterium]